jgi:hypothetical protein
MFYIRALEPLAGDGPRHPSHLLSGQEQIARVKEVVSPVVDHLLGGMFEGSKLLLPYSVYYYHAMFEIFTLPSESLTRPSWPLLQEAINSCIQNDPELSQWGAAVLAVFCSPHASTNVVTQAYPLLISWWKRRLYCREDPG